MHFNIVVGNHGDLDKLEPLAPLVNYVRSTLSVCGHTVTIVHNGLFKDAINLFLENFPDSDIWPAKLRGWKRKHGLKIGVIATELLLQNTIPYAQHGIYTKDPNEKGEYIQRRIAGFNAVVPEVDFLWSFLQRTADEYKSRCKISRFFPVGHVRYNPPQYPMPVKDIDVVFFGTMTPHRLSILEKFSARNSMNTVFVGRHPYPESSTALVSPGFYPSYMLASILDRAKLGLNLTLCSTNESTSGIDPRFVSCARVSEMLEHDVCIVSEEIPCDNPYSEFMISSAVPDLPDVCLRLLRSGEWRDHGLRAAARFRDQMDVKKICAPVIDETINALAAY